MRNISEKQDNVGDRLTADEFNSFISELEHIVTESGQTLDASSDTDLYMISKAVNKKKIHETLTENYEFEPQSVVGMIAFLTAFDDDYELIPDSGSTFIDGYELTIVNTGTVYSIIFNGEYITAGTTQRYIYDGDGDTWY